MNLLLFLSLAMAADPHAGVPLQDIPALGEPDFLTPDLGWSVPVEGGFVRGFVGQNAAEAARWLQEAQMAITTTLPAIAGLGDEAYGDPDGLVLVRDANVALMVRAPDTAQTIAETILERIPQQPQPWPEAPRLVAGNGVWTVSAPNAIHVQFSEGGQILPGAAQLTFTDPPGMLVAWDAYGRPAVWEATTEDAQSP